MGTFFEDKDRNVIPRLRSFGTTLALGELDSIGVGDSTTNNSIGTSDPLRSKVQAWKEHRTVSFAADLVSAAFVLQQMDPAVEAAQFLLSRTSGATDATKVIADQVLNPEVLKRNQIGVTDVSLPHGDDIHKKIHSVRIQIHNEPRNAILWVELSRQYALLGVEHKALRAMDTAVSLAPTNRFVLRSASRLYIHVGKVGKAHFILQRSDSTRYDPWLLSAEIAAGSAANRTSRLIRVGQEMLLDDSIASFQKNELASAVGTLELANGKTKSARNLFRQALRDPTENSVAQVEWAVRKGHMEPLDLDFERIRDETPLSFEAHAWSYFSLGDWKRALRLSLNWLRDQPFSKRPILFSTFIAGSLLEDYRSAERIIEVGLRANPDEPILLNNLAFTYASSGNIDAAEKKFSRIEPSQIKGDPERIAITATQGLLFFRRGNSSEGRAFYRRAIEQAKKRGMRSSSAVAAIYLAREEILSKSEEINAAIELATEEARVLTDPYIQAILEKVLVLRDLEKQIS